MKSAELALQVEGVIQQATQRILGTGHDSYATGPAELQPFGSAHKVIVGEEHQRFEDETWRDNFDELEAELFDTINWAAMTVLKLREARARAEANSYPA